MIASGGVVSKLRPPLESRVFSIKRCAKAHDMLLLLLSARWALALANPRTAIPGGSEGGPFRDRKIAASLKQTEAWYTAMRDGSFRDRKIAASLKPAYSLLEDRVTALLSAIERSRPH